jgi:multiple sugar transport system permease protein
MSTTVGQTGRRSGRALSRRVLGYVVLAFFAVVFIYPFILSLATSFKSQADVGAHPISLIPKPLDARAWRFMTRYDVPRWALNSLIVTTSVTFMRIVLDSMAGYALARLKFRGRASVSGAIVATMAVPGIVLAIPRFLVLKQLGMLNSYTGMILPLATDAFGIFLMKQFFETIPREIEEAARVDGANTLQIFFKVVLPLAAPGVITLSILSFQGVWNEFLHILISRPSRPDLATLPVGLATLRGGAVGQSLDFPILLAGSILTIIPVAIVFIIFQRFFVSGVAATGVKG